MGYYCEFVSPGGYYSGPTSVALINGQARFGKGSISKKAFKSIMHAPYRLHTDDSIKMMLYIFHVIHHVIVIAFLQVVFNS